MSTHLGVHNNSKATREVLWNASKKMSCSQVTRGRLGMYSSIVRFTAGAYIRCSVRSQRARHPSRTAVTRRVMQIQPPSMRLTSSRKGHCCMGQRAYPDGKAVQYRSRTAPSSLSLLVCRRSSVAAPFVPSKDSEQTFQSFMELKQRIGPHRVH